MGRRLMRLGSSYRTPSHWSLLGLLLTDCSTNTFLVSPRLAAARRSSNRLLAMGAYEVGDQPR